MKHIQGSVNKEDSLTEYGMRHLRSSELHQDVWRIWASHGVIFLSVFSPFCKKVPLDSHETCCLSSLELRWEMWIIWAPMGHIFRPFLPWIRPKLGQESVFHLFCLKFPLESHESCSRSLQLLLQEMWRVWALRSHIFRPFVVANRAKIGPKVSFLSSLLKVSTGFKLNVLFKLTGTISRSVKNIWAPMGPIFGHKIGAMGPKCCLESNIYSSFGHHDLNLQQSCIGWRASCLYLVLLNEADTCFQSSHWGLKTHGVQLMKSAADY